MLVVPYKDRGIQKDENIYNEKKRSRSRRIRIRIRKETVCVCVCVPLWYIPKRRTERIIFCCRCYIDGPVFSLSFHPSAVLLCIYIYICVCLTLWFFVRHTCTYFHFFFLRFFHLFFGVLWIISRRNEERESNLNTNIHTS